MVKSWPKAANGYHGDHRQLLSFSLIRSQVRQQRLLFSNGPAPTPTPTPPPTTTDDRIGVDPHFALYGNSDQNMPILAYGNTILDAQFISPSLRQSLRKFKELENHNMKILIALLFSLTVFLSVNAYAVTLAWDAPNGTDPIV